MADFILLSRRRPFCWAVGARFDEGLTRLGQGTAVVDLSKSSSDVDLVDWHLVAAAEMLQSKMENPVAIKETSKDPGRHRTGLIDHVKISCC